MSLNITSTNKKLGRRNVRVLIRALALTSPLSRKQNQMQAIIDGRTYNTTTASEICTLPCSSNNGDFRFHETTLYRTTKGAFFLAGKGGPMSMWAKSEGNGWSNGQGIKVVSAAEARMQMEDANCGAEDFEACGLTLEEG